MITMTGVMKRFGAREVLRGVDLSPAPGRVMAIVGPNGAGKSTLIKCVLGLTRPDAGRIVIDGAVVGDDPAYRERLGYMPQNARFPNHITVRELIAMMQGLRQACGAALPLIERFGITPYLDTRVGVLSGGTRQRVSATIALMHAPSLLVLDEPTAGLDPVSSGVLKELLTETRERGATVLLTSHVMSELEEVADDVAFLMEGRVWFSGGIGELKRRTRQFTLERAIASVMRETAA